MILQNVQHSNDLRKKIHSFPVTIPLSKRPHLILLHFLAAALPLHQSDILMSPDSCAAFCPQSSGLLFPFSSLLIISGYLVYKIVASVSSFLWLSFFSLHSFTEWSLWLSLTVSIKTDHVNGCHSDHYG